MPRSAHAKAKYMAIVFSIFTLSFVSSHVAAQTYYDNSSFNLVSANNGGQVRLRNAPAGTGNPGNIRNLANSAGLPAVVRDSRLTYGAYSKNITQMAAVKETMAYLANGRPNVYSGSGIVVSNGNLEQHRAAIKANGGTFIFRGEVNVSSKEKLIQVGPNTTIWIDGLVRYTGPVIPGTIPDEFSVSDVINGIFEVRGTNNLAVNNVKIYGTKRGKIIGNNRLAAVYTKFAKNLNVHGLNTERCRNVLFLNNVYGNSLIKGNFIFDSTRRAIHIKASSGMTVLNNLVFDADVDGIDVDAYANKTNVLRNVLIKSGSRYQVWTEIVALDNIIDGNVGIHYNGTDGGFQENGSEAHQNPTARNNWKNNHIFYANSSTNWKQGFSFHPSRKIDRASTTFENNFVWQEPSNAYKRNPKNNTTTDVSYYVGSSSSTPQPPTSEWKQLQFRHSGKCLDNKASTAVNAGYHQWSCGASANRDFKLVDMGGGFVRVLSSKSGRCMDTLGNTANGSSVVQGNCSGSDNQLWKLLDKGSGWMSLQSKANGKCIDVAAYSLDNGGNIHVWNCHGNNNQQFKLIN